MRQSEDLSRLGVLPIYEDKWRKIVTYREAAEFLYVQLPVGIVFNYATSEYEYPSLLGAPNDQAQEILPAPSRLAQVIVDP